MCGFESHRRYGFGTTAPVAWMRAGNRDVIDDFLEAVAIRGLNLKGPFLQRLVALGVARHEKPRHWAVKPDAQESVESSRASRSRFEATPIRWPTGTPRWNRMKLGRVETRKRAARA